MANIKITKKIELINLLKQYADNTDNADPETDGHIELSFRQCIRIVEFVEKEADAVLV